MSVIHRMPFRGQRELDRALALLTVLDVVQLRGGHVPPLYQSGVYYEREDTEGCYHPLDGGCEDWLSVREVLRQGKGDCEDLCSWRSAELILRGERARAIAGRTPAGWHITVRRGDGRIEDPSRVLGMGGPSPRAVAARQVEVAALRARGERGF